jgi:CRISPR-associated protein Cmr3
MNSQMVRIRGIDSLLFRDGRPFGAEIGSLSARTLSCPYPATVTGFVRTFLGNRMLIDWNRREDILRVLAIAVYGPLLERNGEAVFHAPADALITGTRKEPSVFALRPWQDLPEHAGCDLPKHLVPLRVDTDEKPVKGYEYWDGASLMRWLESADGSGFTPPQPVGKMEVEQRTHVAIDDEKGVSAESLLYSVEYLSFERYRWGNNGSHERWALLARLESEEDLSLARGVGLLGGEKRLALLEPAEDSCWPTCSETLRRALSQSGRVRMFLATPAIFEGGWKPGWLNGKLEGSPPCARDMKLRLVAAAVKRRGAVSGWSYRQDRQQPKPLRLLAPAGSVYFFEVLDGDPVALAEAWLRPVSDDVHDRRDGYGLVLWGIW